MCPRPKSPCAACPSRGRCRRPCDAVERLLAAETRHWRGSEVLAEPRVLANLAGRRHALTLAEIQRERLTEAEIDAVPGLTARQREVLALSVVEGRSQREIGAILGITQTTVLDHLHAARRRIRDYLALRAAADIALSTLPKASPGL